METTSITQKPQKKQKQNEAEDIDGNSKCLVNLPEEILRHILSFLPTEVVVRTSVLCKRWEYLWVSMPNLVFKPSIWAAKRPFLMNFVERALCLRGSSDIKHFTLRCEVQCDAVHVKTWISAVVRLNVQELLLDLENFEGEFSLPYCLFTCKTLTSLHLAMPCILNLPNVICFSNLKILAIERVTFSNEYSTQQLFSGLPSLEELKLKDCSWGDLMFVSICAPKLHSLTLSIFAALDDDDDKGSHDDCQVMIFGDSLKEFYYKGYVFSDYCLYNSFSLEKAEIVAYTEKSEEMLNQCAYRTFKLLIGLSNVKILKLSGGELEALKYASELLPNMPIFNNLMDLAFVHQSVNLDCRTLLKILQKSPCLETLNCSQGLSLSSDWEEDDRILDPVPPSFLSNLKCIQVHWYVGNIEELTVVKILLKNVIALEKIVITCSWELAKDLEKKENLYKKLIELPRGSQNCKIVLK